MVETGKANCLQIKRFGKIFGADSRLYFYGVCSSCSNVGVDALAALEEPVISDEIT